MEDFNQLNKEGQDTGENTEPKPEVKVNNFTENNSADTEDLVDASAPQTETADKTPVFGASQPPVGGSGPQSPVGTSGGDSASTGGPVVTTAAPMVGGPALSTPQKSGNGKKIVLVVVAILVFLLIAGGVAAFFVVNHLNNKPEKVLADAVANTAADLLDRKPVSTVSKVVYGSKEDGLTVTVDLSTMQKDEDGKLDVKVKIESEDLNIDVANSAIYFGTEEFYVKMDNLKETVDQYIDQVAADSKASSAQVAEAKSKLSPMVTKLDGKWVKITADDIEGLAGRPSSDDSVNKCTEAVQALRISDEDKKSIKKLFEENQFITASEVLDKQDAGGEKSFHYVIKLNEDPAINFSKGLVELKSFERVMKDCEINKDDIKKSESSAEDSLDESKLELWVGSKNRRFTKARFTGKDKTVEFDFSTEVTFQESTTKIDKPTEFITVQELQAEFEKLSNSGGGSVLGDSISL